MGLQIGCDRASRTERHPLHAGRFVLDIEPGDAKKHQRSVRAAHCCRSGHVLRRRGLHMGAMPSVSNHMMPISRNMWSGSIARSVDDRALRRRIGRGVVTRWENGCAARVDQSAAIQLRKVACAMVILNAVKDAQSTRANATPYFDAVSMGPLTSSHSIRPRGPT